MRGRQAGLHLDKVYHCIPSASASSASTTVCPDYPRVRSNSAMKSISVCTPSSGIAL